MYNRKYIQVSIKKEMPWKILSDSFISLSSKFKEKVLDVFGDSVRATIRKYRCSSMMRFTVIFNEQQLKPEETHDRIIQIIQEAVSEIKSN